MKNPLYLEDHFRRERERAERLAKFAAPDTSWLRVRTDLFDAAIPPSVRAMLDMHRPAMDRYAAFAPDFDRLLADIRSVGDMARQPFHEVLAASALLADPHLRFAKQALEVSGIGELRAVTFPDVEKRFAALNRDRIEYLLPDAGIAEQLVRNATVQLLDQIRMVVPEPLWEAIDGLTTTIEARPFLASVSASGTPVDAHVVANVKECVDELLAQPEGFAGFIRYLAALLPSVSDSVASVLLWLLVRLMLRQPEPESKLERRRVIRRAQHLLDHKLSRIESRHVRVAAVALPLRASARRTNSHIVGTVACGTPVVVVHAGRGWTLVRPAADGESTCGWVNTRYLRPAAARRVQQ